jgi:hypothetical protein
MPQKKTSEIRLSWVIGGLFVGFVVAGLIALFRFTHTRTYRHHERHTPENYRGIATLPTQSPEPDPIRVSTAEGRAAARRRLDDLGFSH